MFFRFIICSDKNGYGNFIESLIKINIDKYLKNKKIIVFTCLKNEKYDILRKFLGSNIRVINNDTLFNLLNNYNKFKTNLFNFINNLYLRSDRRKKFLKRIQQKLNINPLNFYVPSHKKLTKYRVELFDYLPEEIFVSNYYLNKYSLIKKKFILINLREDQSIDNWRSFSHEDIILLFNYLKNKNYKVVIFGYNDKKFKDCIYIEKEDYLFAPIVLANHCSSYIFCNSGPEKIRYLTTKPSLGININDLVGCYPHRANQFIKMVNFKNENGKNLSFEEYLFNPKYFGKKKIFTEKISAIEIVETYKIYEQICNGNIEIKNKYQSISKNVSNYLSSNNVHIQRILKKHFRKKSYFGDGYIL